MIDIPKLKIKNKYLIDANTSPEIIIELILTNRGIKKPYSDFLNPPYPKADFINFKPSLKFINKYLSKNIFIYGDYDVDGITATAILWQTLTGLGVKAHPFIPNRHLHGYGFNFKAFSDHLKTKNLSVDLIISVDNGIVATKEIKKAQKAGYDFMVIDHHLADAKLPPANHILHSTQISASALTWFFCHQLDKKADLGLAALGTVADCLPLIGINRSLVVHGLQILKQNPSPGIKKLISVSGAKQETLSVYDLGFLLSPRINAAGRLFDPTDALRLLCSTNTYQSHKYAQILQQNNLDRQDLQQKSLDKIITKYKPEKNNLIFIADKSLNLGIIGLVAGRLTEKYNLPSIIITQGKEISKGSCRSISKVNIIKLLRKFDSLFIELGGHQAAAGFSILTKNIPILENKIKKYFLKQKTLQNIVPVIEVEAQMDPTAVSLKNIKAINQLEPFGIGHPRPLFILKDLQISQLKKLGANEDHLKIVLNQNLSAIAFKKGDYFSSLKVGEAVNLVASLDINTWNNISAPQLIVKEIIPK
jgi:single-stranded-DNA-specific exonuclease